MTWTDCDLPAARMDMSLGVEARFPAVRRGCSEGDIARRFAAVIADDDGQRACFAGVGFAAEPAALAGKRQARLAEYRCAERQLGRRRLALGVHDELILAGWRITRQSHRCVDVFRLAGANRDAGDLLAA